MGITVFGNGTDIVHWEANPQRRGTFDILSTCIVTILLCVWTAVHLNIPKPNERWRQIGRKIIWMFLALIAPEMVAYTAWYQRHEAQAIMQEYNQTFGLPNPSSFWSCVWSNLRNYVNKLGRRGNLNKTPTVKLEALKDDDSTSASARTHAWTMTHGFYALMGGFVVDATRLPPEKKFLDDTSQEYWFLTLHGVRYMLKTKHRQEQLPDVAEADIKAKSRANGLTKALVCLQATWFCVQCITRLAQQLPISLLELNTFGHCICALLIYFLWWDKPFDVEIGTPVLGETMLSYRALHWMGNNETEASKKVKGQISNALVENSSNMTDLFNRRPFNELTLAVRDTRSPLVSIESITGDLRPRNAAGELSAEIILEPGESLLGTGFRTMPNPPARAENAFRPLSFDFINYPSPYSDIPAELIQSFLKDISITLDATSVVRWRLAWQAISETKWKALHMDSAKEEIDEDLLEASKINWKFLSGHCSDFPKMLMFGESPRSLLLEFGFVFSGIVYGGLHALAWNATFSTRFERIMWRISACSVTGGAPAIIAFMYISVELIWKFTDTYSGRGAYVAQTFLDIILAILALLIICLYVLARAYLVVGCFINLSHMPAGVYQLPQWSTYFPHIS